MSFTGMQVNVNALTLSEDHQLQRVVTGIDELFYFVMSQPALFSFSTDAS